MQPQTTGNIFIICAASGTGKTTLVSRLTSHHPDIRVSVSHTTRPPRPGETDGQHYHFVGKETFAELAGQGAFLEYAEVFGHFYGTAAAAVENMCQSGLNVILEIDVQGAEQVRKALPQAVSIFILPPSMQVLEERLRNRRTDSEEVIARRLAQAAEEIRHAFAFDYVVSNRDLVEAEADLLAIIRATASRASNRAAAVEKVLGNP